MIFDGRRTEPINGARWLYVCMQDKQAGRQGPMDDATDADDRAHQLNPWTRSNPPSPADRPRNRTKTHADVRTGAGVVPVRVVGRQLLVDARLDDVRPLGHLEVVLRLEVRRVGLDEVRGLDVPHRHRAPHGCDRLSIDDRVCVCVKLGGGVNGSVRQSGSHRWVWSSSSLPSPLRL